MDDELFPSGPWTGFYNYTGPEDRHRMDLHLTFADERMSGDGLDDVAAFLIEGRYNTVSRECSWTKIYPGSHEVFYRGFREGHGIWGTWEIGRSSRGGFHIWPRKIGSSELASSEVGEEMPTSLPVTVVSSPQTLPKLR